MYIIRFYLVLSVFRLFQFFLIPCTSAYELLDECNLKIVYLEHQLQNLIESALIFGLPPPTKSELDSCRNEIKLIKVFYSWHFLFNGQIKWVFAFIRRKLLSLPLSLSISSCSPSTVRLMMIYSNYGIS